MTFRLGRRSFIAQPLDSIGCTLARLLYRVRVEGGEHLPTQGGAVLICNHLSYADVAVLQLACPRPLRFMGYRGPEPHWFFEWVFRQAGVIEVQPRRLPTAMRRAIRAAQAGEIVCIFAEGQISRTGQLMEIQRGFSVIAQRAGVPVIPAAIDGLWGSVFSFSGKRYLWKSPRLMPTAVCVAFGPPVAPEQATVGWARKAILDLWAQAFQARPFLRRHVGREVVRALARQPGRVIVVDRTAERREVRAAQAIAVAAVLARRWRQTIAETRVGIVLPPGAGCILANLAVQCAGKVPVNLNFTAGRAAVLAGLEAAGIKTLITADAFRDRFPDFPWLDRSLDLATEIKAAGGKRRMLPWVLAAWILPNQMVANLLRLPRRGDRDEAALLFTSGSAGSPKGVPLTHRNILANCEQISSMSILPATANLLGCLPIFHSFGLTVTVWYPILRGCGLATVPSPLDSRRIIDAIREERATVMIAAPTFLRPILRKAEPADLKTLEIVVAGSEKLPEDLHRGFLERFHIDILEGYGLTEASPVTNVNQPHPPMTTATASPQSGKQMGAVGRLLPGITARIVDPDSGREAGVGERGLLWLKGANIFGGYLGEPGTAAAAFTDGWFRTGDLASFDEAGFLTIAGRLSRFSKIGGEMVPHGWLEEKLVERLGIDADSDPAVVVVGVPDPSRGESLTLVTTRVESLEVLREHLMAAGMPNLWIPRSIVRVERIPVLGTGKIDFQACQALARDKAEA
jgi:acyl-[acyl-carrier-protein]-phospholipid O-acyltransferase/long-chain-fatty-acid--[acyl-carrier-protein] ligase